MNLDIHTGEGNSPQYFYTRLESKIPPKGYRNIGHATYLSYFQDDEDERVIGIQYHRTVIFAIWPDGSFQFDTGGWKTATTKARINEIAGLFDSHIQHVYQKNHQWYIVLTGGPTISFDADSVALNSEGEMSFKSRFVFSRPNFVKSRRAVV